MALVVYDEFVACRKSNYCLHRDNDQIFVRMDALARGKSFNSRERKLIRSTWQD